MTRTLGKGTAIGIFLATILISPLASAFTMTFNDATGLYTGSNGLIGTATTNGGGSLDYTSAGFFTQSGLGRNGGGITQNNSITVLFNQRILLDSINLNNWSIGSFWKAGDSAVLSYLPTWPTQTLDTTGWFGNFSTGSVSVDGFTVTGGPKSGYGKFGGSTNFLLRSISYSETPVPATMWLFGSALLGLGLMKRKKA
jgi:hypothetical protein